MKRVALATLAALGLTLGLTDLALAQPSAYPQSLPGNAGGAAPPHFDGTAGDGPFVHRSVPARSPSDARQAPHLHNDTDGPRPHQPGPEPRAAATGPAPHLDNTTDGPTPHAGRH